MADLMAPRPFGKGRPLMVPPIAVGCAPLGNMPEAFGYGVSEKDALATVRAVLDSPIPYLDTAAHYGDGESERRIGIVLRERGGLPAGAILQTKEGRYVPTGDYSGDMVRRRMERSLQLLGVDHVDAVYLHDAEWTTFEAAMAPGGPVDVLQRFREQGVFDYLGVASGPNHVELQYIETGLFDAVITHNRYTLVSAVGNEVIDAAHARGMAVLNAAPYASGILAKGARSGALYAYQAPDPVVVERVEALEAICARYEVPLAAAALQYSMRDPRITVTIVGMTRPQRLDETLALAGTPIPDALWEEIDALPPLSDEDPEANRWR